MKKVFIFVYSIFVILPAKSQLSTVEIDRLVLRTMETFEVPGIAVAVIKDNQVVHSKGYGVSSLNTQQPVDEKTLFGIASNSKAFTGASLGILVEEGKLEWDSKVTDFVPEFKLYDPYVTAEFTVRDLLVHRSGLGLGAGDLMIWPGGNDFTKEDIIHNLRYLKPVSSFRSKYDYDNLLYIVAGEVIERASGITWEDFIQTRFFDPLNIKDSAPSYASIKNNKNVIDAHASVSGKVQVIQRDLIEKANAAGGIYASIQDMSKWVLALLNGGKYENTQLFKEETLKELWSPQTIIPLRNPGAYNSQFSAYGLGWRLQDIKGYKQVSHTGGLSGIVTQTVLIPDLKLGILVYTNQQTGAAFNAISNTIKDSYLGSKQNEDWVGFYSQSVGSGRDNAQNILKQVDNQIQDNQTNQRNPDFDPTGTYIDDWFGEAVISLKKGQLWFASKRSPNLSGPLYYYKGNTFAAKWTDRAMHADAFLVFSLDREGNPNGIKLSTISPLTDFSYDFQDLDFKRKE